MCYNLILRVQVCSGGAELKGMTKLCSKFIAGSFMFLYSKILGNRDERSLRKGSFP